MNAYITEVWQVLLELAPWLLLGTAVAALLHLLLPEGFIHRQLSGPRGVFKAVFLGVPLPLCSCGVIPTGLGLKRQGASDGATIGFLISTPQTGVDSLMVSAGFLGWPFALFKLGSAAVTGLVGGLIADRVSPAEGLSPAAPSTPTHRASPWSRGALKGALDHGLELLSTIWGWLLIGVLASAALTLWLPPSLFEGLLGYGTAVAVAAVLGLSLPLYVCATASVPIAAALVAGGMPPGLALIFLMAGPATNVATLGAVYRGLGGRMLTIYLSVITVGSIALGLLFDTVIDAETARQAMHHHEHGAWWMVASAWILVALIAGFALRDARGLLRRLAPGPQGTPELTVPVEGLTCGGCASRLEARLNETEGVESATVSRGPDVAVVRGHIDAQALGQAIQAAGFKVG